MSNADFRSLQATFVPRADAPGQGRLVFWCMPPRRVEYARKALQALGVLRRGKLPPTGKLDLVIPTPTRNKEEDWEIAELTGIRLPLADTIRGLARLDLSESKRRRVSDSLRAWSMAAKLAVELVASEHVLPLLDRNDKDQLYARWAITNLTPQTRERIARLERSLPLAAHCLVYNEGQPVESRQKRKKNRRRRKRKPVTEATTTWRPDVLLRAFLDAAADALCREALPSTAKDRPRKDNRELAPWELRWRFSLTSTDPLFESAGLVERRLPEEIARWASPVRPRTTAGDAYTVCYQLEQPGSSDESSAGPDTWYLRYRLQAIDDPNFLLDARDVWHLRSTKLELHGRSLHQPHETLLESLAETARLFPPVLRSLELPRPEGVLLSTEEAWHFIGTVGPILAQFGVGIRVPRELRSDGQQRLRLKFRVGQPLSADAFSGDPSKVGLAALAAFQWQVALGEHDLTPEEFREVAAMQQPLVRWRGQWMAVDPSELAEMQRLFERSSITGTMDRSTALAAALNGTVTMADGSGEVEVVAEGDIRETIELLRNAETANPLDVPAGFEGSLRPYQLRGLTWMHNLTRLGFGCLLADDMGLGKTIQVIALLLSHAEKGLWGKEPALLICPTSVLGNWERELKKFAPELEVVRHHGRTRAGGAKELTQPKGKHRVVLTTYVLARMDHALLASRTWSYLVLDEAQNIKNPASQQARAIRILPAERRLALTGTPVENRLTELWSLLEFANPGLLGTLNDFRQRFSLPIERFGDTKAAHTLRQIVSPFLLRRVKTDPNVMQDLPDKLEQKIYCTLTREQATLYQALVDKTMERITSSSGFQRKANILTLLTGLKQICNHPAHFLKTEHERLIARSGKLTRLTEMMEEVLAEGDRALVFTQYKEMGDLLQRHLEQQFKVDVPFLHGGCSATQRDAMVHTFQNDPDAPPILLLSLKAGGTGLNLTQATHVFHFDRWWNPAVEDQATDRAYRIGQTQHVQVHKMIVSGTVEEKIDDILESKRNLASAVVGEGEAWLTELNDDELMDLFSLGQAAAIDDDADVEGEA